MSSIREFRKVVVMFSDIVRKQVDSVRRFNKIKNKLRSILSDFSYRVPNLAKIYEDVVGKKLEGADEIRKKILRVITDINVASDVSDVSNIIKSIVDIHNDIVRMLRQFVNDIEKEYSDLPELEQNIKLAEEACRKLNKLKEEYERSKREYKDLIAMARRFEEKLNRLMLVVSENNNV